MSASKEFQKLSEDGCVCVHKGYQVHAGTVPGGVHVCNHQRFIPQVTALPPWAPNYQPRPSQYDPTISQANLFATHYASWFAANQQNFKHRQSMENTMRICMRHFQNPDEEIDELSSAMFNQYLSSQYRMINLAQIPRYMIPKDFEGEIVDTKDHGTYYIQLGTDDMETGENFEEIGAEQTIGSNWELQRCVSPEINVCDIEDEDNLQ